jgi:hypothetical protein
MLASMDVLSSCFLLRSSLECAYVGNIDSVQVAERVRQYMVTRIRKESYLTSSRA